MNYDDVSDWEQDNYEDLSNDFIEEYQDLWASFVLDRFESELQNEDDMAYDRMKEDKAIEEYEREQHEGMDK